uniref:CHK kinase-like domain-containing protein n=1 Tax=Stenopsyche marmorata TaxID=177930 RepID=A0A2Z6FLE8_9NEOP|nr:hypothetical protein [Stenopsyche marmorata]
MASASNNVEDVGMPPFATKMIRKLARHLRFEDYQISVGRGSFNGDNFLGEIFRVNISGRKVNKIMRTVNLIVKIAPKSMRLRRVLPVRRFFVREIQSHLYLFPALDDLQSSAHLPMEERFYFTTSYECVPNEHHEMIVIEDHSANGFQKYDRLKPLDYDHLQLCITNLARFHATSFVLYSKDTETFQAVSSSFVQKLRSNDGTNSYFSRFVPPVVSLLDDQNDQNRIIRFVNSILNGRDPFSADETCPYNVLTHGDFWINNLLFKYIEGKVTDMRVLDWQTTRWASPIIDIAYIIFTGTDQATRANHYEEMLNLYYKVLARNITRMGSNIAVCYPEHVYRDQIKRMMPFGLQIAIFGLPIVLSEITDDTINNNNEQGELSENCKQRLKDIMLYFLRGNMI